MQLGFHWVGEGCGEGARGPGDARSEFRDPSKEVQSYTVLFLTKEQCSKCVSFFTFPWKINAAGPWSCLAGILALECHFSRILLCCVYQCQTRGSVF